MSEEKKPMGCGTLIIVILVAFVIGITMEEKGLNDSTSQATRPPEQAVEAVAPVQPKPRPAAQALIDHATAAGFRLGKRTAWDGRAANHQAATIAGEAHGRDYLAYENPGSGTIDQYITEFQIGYHSGWHAAKEAGAQVE